MWDSQSFTCSASLFDSLKDIVARQQDMVAVCHSDRVVCAVGLYLSRHADIVRAVPFHPGFSGILIVFKIIKVSQSVSKSAFILTYQVFL